MQMAALQWNGHFCAGGLSVAVRVVHLVVLMVMAAGSCSYADAHDCDCNEQDSEDSGQSGA